MYDDLIRVPITSKKTAIFDCPICRSKKIHNVSAHLISGKPVKLNVTCSCGKKYKSILDKRKQYRRKTNFAGSYSVVSEGTILSKEFMTVCDISLTGMKLKMNIIKNITIRDILKVEFRLDNYKRSLIQKKN